MPLEIAARRGPLAGFRARFLALLLLAACGDGPADPSDEEFTVVLSYAPVNSLNAADIWAMTDDGRARRQLTRLPGPDRVPAWSRDGEQVAFLHYSDVLSSDPPTLMVVNRDGTGLRTVHAGTPEVVWARWAPAGDRLAVSYRGGASASGVALIDADGSGFTPVAGTEGGGNASWSPSGDRLLFGRNGGLWTIAPTGGTAQQIASGAGSGRYSPDGMRIAALSSQGIVVMNADGSGRTVVDMQDFPYSRVVGYLAWSGDGTRLMFTASTGSSALDGSFELFTVSVAGGTPTNVTRTAVDQYEMEADWR